MKEEEVTIDKEAWNPFEFVRILAALKDEIKKDMPVSESSGETKFRLGSSPLAFPLIASSR